MQGGGGVPVPGCHPDSRREGWTLKDESLQCGTLCRFKSELVEKEGFWLWPESVDRTRREGAPIWGESLLGMMSDALVGFCLSALPFALWLILRVYLSSCEDFIIMICKKIM